MKICEVKDRSDELLSGLLSVWERSVRATHLFLSEENIRAISTFVPEALTSVEHLVTAGDEASGPVGFMGVDGRRLEMLFLDPSVRGKGTGGQLLRYGFEVFGICEVCVNEQNPQALGFYEHMGFRVYRRTRHDEQGNPFPLLYMRLQDDALNDAC